MVGDHAEGCPHDETVTKFGGAVVCTQCRLVVRYAGQARYITTMVKEESK